MYIFYLFMSQQIIIRRLLEDIFTFQDMLGLEKD